MNNLNFGVINVPVAILWTEPGEKRTHDSLMLGKMTDPAAWADNMDEEMRLWLVGKVETQALLGEKVVILEQQNDWLKIAAVSQQTSKNPLGYPGWIPAIQVQITSCYLDEQMLLPSVAITVPKALLYRDALCSETICELSYQTTLPLLIQDSLVLAVRLPDGTTGYLLPNAANYTRQHTPAGTNIVTEANHFLGLKYIWGGTSSYGFDCSGFAFRVYQSQGISIPRDADDQAANGIPVCAEDLMPGDLVFFADEGGKGDVHHVGIYAGNHTMVHAPHSKSFIQQDLMFSGKYGEEYCGARRYYK